ncbi:MAG TPA: autotransporter-associated beta strand repeat-containing protein, partial [Lacibacter sp.]|nr:autotransporter-associated beta strand repeat-containing protein [Lacibacter sp.]
MKAFYITRNIGLISVAILIAASMNSEVSAQQPVIWRSEAANGNWENGNCAEIGNGNSQWWYPNFGSNSARNRPDCSDGSTTRHNLEIGNNHQTAMTINNTFWGIRSLTLTSGATSNRTFTGSVDDNTRGIGLSNGIYNNSNSGVTHSFVTRIGIDAATINLSTLNSGCVTEYNRAIFGNANTIVFQGSGNNSVSGVISGTGATVRKEGSGNLLFNAAHTYTGQTQIDNGELWIQSSGSISSSSGIFVGNGTLLSNVTKLWLSHSSGGTTFTNNFTINNGNATTRIVGGLNTSGTHTFSGNITNNSTTGGLDVEAFAGGTVVFSGVISGSGFITKTRPGTVIISGSSQNTYTNTTRVAAGTLVFNKTAGVRATGTGTTTIDAGTTLRTDAANQFGSTLLENNGTFNLNGFNQTLALRGSGSTTLGAGIITINNSATDTYSGTVTGTTGGIVKQNSGTQVLSGNLTGFSGGVSVTAGTLTLSGANTYTGGTTVSGGQLNINSATAIGGAAGTLTLSGGNIDNTSGGTVTLSNNNPQAWNSNFTYVGSNGLNMGTGAVTINANRTVTVSSNTLRVGGIISGAFSLTKAGAGALVLTGTNEYTGGTTINAGTLAIGAGSTTGSLPSGNVTNNGNLTFDRSDNISVSNVISGSGSLSKLGAGTLTLTGTNTYSGQTNITAGTIQLSGTGTVGTNSDVRISSGASLNLNGVNTTVRSISETGTGNGGTVALGSATLTISGIAGSFFQNSISGAGSLVKNGAGTLALYGTQSYTGSTTVDGGELSTSVAMASKNYLLTGGTFRITTNNNIIPDDAVFNISGGTFAVDANETVQDITITSGTITIASGRTLTINGTLSITPGASIIGDGQIQYGPDGKLIITGGTNYTLFNRIFPATSGPKDFEMAVGGTVTLHASRTIPGTITLQSGTFAVGTHTLTINGTITASSGSLTSASSGTVVYNGATAQNVLLANYGNLTLSNAGTKSLPDNIGIAGNFTVSGGAVSVPNNVSFNGATQSIAGLEYVNIAFSGSAVGTKSFTSNGSFSGTMTFSGTAGTIDFDGPGSVVFTIKSTSSGTASIGNATGWTLSGNITSELYIPNNRKWRGVSHPLSSATPGNTIFNSWQNNGSVIAGQGALLWSPAGTGGFTQNTATGATANIRGYNNGTGSSSSTGSFNTPASTDATNLFAGGRPVPYLVFVTDHHKTGINEGNMTAGASVTTLRATGTLYQGGFSNTGLAAGFHFIPNPYPSAIDY